MIEEHALRSDFFRFEYCSWILASNFLKDPVHVRVHFCHGITSENLPRGGNKTGCAVLAARDSKLACAASAADRERAGEGKGEERSRLARNSCNLMGFFDWYLMPVAIGPIHTPLTYPKGIYKNRAFCPPRDFRVTDTDFVLEIREIVRRYQNQMLPPT